MSNLDCLGPGESVDTHIVGIWNKKSDLGVISVQVVLSQLKMANLDCWCPGESVDTHIVGVVNKKDKVTSAFPSVCRHQYYRDLEQKRSDLGVISVQVVLSQLKMPNLDCWCPGESIDTHIVGVANKKDEVTSAYPR